MVVVPASMFTVTSDSLEDGGTPLKNRYLFVKAAPESKSPKVENMSKASSTGRLVKWPLIELENLEDVFKRFDVNKQNTLHPYEFQVALEALGFKQDNPYVKRQVFHYRNTRSRVTYQAFEKCVLLLKENRDPLDEVLSIFKIFDVDRTNKINLKDLEKVAESLQETVSSSELQVMIDEFDEDEDGEIGPDEFLSVVMKEDKESIF